MSKYKDDGKSYLAMYPEIEKRWMNKCIICQSQGYKPEMIQKISPDSDQINRKNTLIAYFQPLAVNEIGICEQCDGVLKSKDFTGGNDRPH